MARRTGYKHSEETKKKIGLGNKNKKISTKTKRLISQSLKSFYKKYPESLKRKPFSEEWKRNISLGHIGKKLSEETKRKIGESSKGRRWSKERIKKFSESRKGSNHPSWKGGKKRSHGYIYLTKKEHPFADKRGMIFEHRLVIEKHLGRYLKPEEVVHHINGVLDDNRIENLMLFPNNKAHLKFHYQLRKKALQYYRIHKGYS
ncbi:MAG: HNH endonuclease signature motif containing protein [Deltaproteobacteria bacterium]|nr:HNH endonuclease signature motif containing protein [Deltaproteobacteria bacterium]